MSPGYKAHYLQINIRDKNNVIQSLLSSSSFSSELTGSRILTVRDRYRSLDDRAV
jgi:hypothetical protein